MLKRILAALAVTLLALTPAAADTLTNLHKFRKTPDGTQPVEGLVYANGLYYGVTQSGGAANAGTLFQIDPATGAFATLHSFKGFPTDAGGPRGSLILAGGKLYGAAGGGALGQGALYAFDPKTRNETLVYSFKGNLDGALPSGALTYVNGSLYGATIQGGGGTGTIFKYTLATGTETILHVFTGKDGTTPNGGLVYRSPALYGTTPAGGLHDGGNVFKINPANGAFTVLHSFQGPDGWKPYASLTAGGGVLYGVTSQGGGSGGTGGGAVFRIDPATGDERVIYTFVDPTDGFQPVSTLTFAGNILYGTSKGGANICNPGFVRCGNAFSVDPATGVETVLYSFTAANNLAGAQSVLSFRSGVLFGVSVWGGNLSGACPATGCGTVFKLRP